MAMVYCYLQLFQTMYESYQFSYPTLRLILAGYEDMDYVNIIQ